MSEDRNVPPDVIIEADGRIHVRSNRALRHLGQRGGPYRLVPAAGTVVLLRRLSDGGESEARVLVAGEIDPTGSIMEILNLIHSQQWDGMLTVTAGAARRSLSFQKGMVRAGASNQPEERLGAILYRYGIVSRQQIDEALAGRGEDRHLGQTLVERGALTAHDLFSILRKQVEEIFHAILLTREGEYAFQKLATSESKGSLRMSTQELLFEGVRRIDEMKYFRQKIPSAQTVLEPKLPPPPITLEPREEQVRALVDGARDVAAIGRESQLGEFDATKILFNLLQAGFVRVRQAPTPQQIAASDATPEVRLIEIYNPHFSKIFAAAAAKDRDAALRRDLESFFSGSTGLAEIFRGLTIAPDGTLPVEAVMENLGRIRTSRRSELLYQGLSELLDFLLFSAMESLDRRAEQELEKEVAEVLRGPPPGE